MRTFAIVAAIALGGAHASSCLDTCGGCYSMVTHVITCYSDLPTSCPYNSTSYTSPYSGAKYSEFYAYAAAETCPSGLGYCGGTQNYIYGKTCIEGDLASAGCCDFVYEAMVGYQPVSQVEDHAEIDKDVMDMDTWMEGSSSHQSYNFSKAYLHYSTGGESCKSWTDSSSGWPYGSCTTYRTVQGFSKDLTGEAMYDIYKSYWDSFTYADDFVSAALLGTTDPGSSVDFGALTNVERYQLAMKGAAYQNVWIYALHEYEAAVEDCLANDLTDASGAPHAWDEGWAFYAGSQQTAGESDGYLVYTLAEKRCGNFATCGTTGDATTGTAYANIKHLEYATSGLAHIRAGECTEANADLDEIKKWMTVPLIQGTIRYAYKCDPNGGNEGAEACAEAYAFAAALLPQLNNALASAATTVMTNMKIGANVPDGYAAVKAAIESTYISMGISCSDIGGLVDSAGAYMTNLSPCDDSSLVSGAAKRGPATSAALAAVAAFMIMAIRA